MIAVVTRSGHGEDASTNEDACAAFSSADGSVRGFAIADGVGTCHQPSLASQSAIRAIVGYCSTCIQGEIDLRSAFRIASEAVAATGREHQPGADANPGTRNLATTLIVVAETQDWIKVAYLGNGCIYHVRGNYEAFVDRTPLPWNFVNLLNPHSAPNAMGKAELFGFLCDDVQPIDPTVITISRDISNHGEYILAGSDGIHSSDESVPGRGGPGGSRWYRRVPENILSLWRIVGRSLAQGKEPDLLRHELDLWIDQIDLDDDATAGVLISKAQTPVGDSSVRSQTDTHPDGFRPTGKTPSS